MLKTITKAVVMAALFCALPLVAQAAGLGKLTLLSALGQPLNAEIEIVSLQPGEEDLAARLASSQAFALRGHWSCQQVRREPLEPTLVDEPVDQLVVEQPSPAEPRAGELALRRDNGRAHTGHDQVVDAAIAARIRICLVVPQQFARMAVAAVG